jgi:hypothetical protein
MNKLFLLLLLIPLVNATTLFGGENISFETNYSDPVYIVTGNSSNLDGLNITYNGTHININSKLNMKPDNFTLTFFNKETKEVIKEIRVGGGSRTIYRDRNITEYIEVPRDIGKIIEKEVEVEVEKIVKETPTYIYVILTVLSLIVISYIVIAIYNYLAERGFENEQENISI